MPKLTFQYVRQGNRETLSEFLARRFMYHTREEWETLILEGHVYVNGQPVPPTFLLQTRHKIVYHRPPGQEPEVDFTHTVLFEDDQILAVSKSGNIPSTPSGKYWHNCLVHLLQRHYAYADLHAVHRLDRETSGINLFAKNRDTARILGDDFHHGRVFKSYAAILHGHLPKREVDLEAPLRSAENSLIKIRQEVHPEGRPSRTVFRLRAILPQACLVDAIPYTGRTHQIRAHAAHLGHPVWGDKLYADGEERFLQWLSTGTRNAQDRQLLHASALSFNHPVTGQRIELLDPPLSIMRLFEVWPGA
ncbi:MAG: RluA family pseudouridine synthase [Deltaproteobacteria bacterium]|nr:RluA family pseudouridine synthase [Deltaproteobacteria bacterium]